MVVLLSLLAAVCFGMAAVLQFQASASSARDLNLRFTLLWRLLANPRFGLGAAFDVVGGAAQFFALKYGSVPQVLPILASGFVLAILLEHFLARRPIGVGDVVALLVSGAALVVFLVVSPPASGHAIYVSASMAIGHAVLDKIALANGTVLLSGRAGSDLVLKAARAGLSHVCSVSAPSALAVEIATQAGVTLVGFLRPGRFNVYSHPEGIAETYDATRALR